MKCSECASVFRALAALLEAIGDDQGAAAARDWAVALARGGERDLGAFARFLEAFDQKPSSGVDSPAGGFHDILMALGPRIRDQSCRETIKAIFTVSNQPANMALSELDRRAHAYFQQQPHPRVAAFADELSASLDDAARFRATMERLASDKEMTRERVLEVAARVAYPMPKSTTRKRALEVIQSAQDASEAFAAKSLAMKGKSAA